MYMNFNMKNYKTKTFLEDADVRIKQIRTEYKTEI